MKNAKPSDCIKRPIENVTVVKGDLLRQEVDVIVNAWNRNLIPWWLLLPQGVSGAIKRQAGREPFQELAKAGLIPLGQAVLTTAGRLHYKGIIHVAGINLLWRATDFSIRQSVSNALKLAIETGIESIAFPAIGAGSGGFGMSKSLDIMIDQLSQIQPPIPVTLVQYHR